MRFSAFPTLCAAVRRLGGEPADAPRGSTLEMAQATDIRSPSDARPTQAQRRPEHLTEQRARPPIVEMRRVTKVYPGGHVGLEHVSLRVDRGEFVFLVGPTGCGKTTLIKTLIRELRPPRARC